MNIEIPQFHWSCPAGEDIDVIIKEKVDKKMEKAKEELEKAKDKIKKVQIKLDENNEYIYI